MPIKSSSSKSSSSNRSTDRKGNLKKDAKLKRSLVLGSIISPEFYKKLVQHVKKMSKKKILTLKEEEVNDRLEDLLRTGSLDEKSVFEDIIGKIEKDIEKFIKLKGTFLALPRFVDTISEMGYNTAYRTDYIDIKDPMKTREDIKRVWKDKFQYELESNDIEFVRNCILEDIAMRSCMTFQEEYDLYGGEEHIEQWAFTNIIFDTTENFQQLLDFFQLTNFDKVIINEGTPEEYSIYRWINNDKSLEVTTTVNPISDVGTISKLNISGKAGAYIPLSEGGNREKYSNVFLIAGMIQMLARTPSHSFVMDDSVKSRRNVIFR